MGTTEYNIILEGKLLVELFRENGETQKTFVLDPNSTFYYRCERNQYHMIIPLTDVAVYVEIKEGPFTENSNVCPTWFFDKNNTDKMKAFNENVKEHAMKRLAKGDTNAVLDEPRNNNAFQ